MKTGRGHNESRLHGIRKACARRSKSGPTWPARAHRARSPRRSQGAVTETQRPCCINPEMRRTCTHIPSSSRDCAERRSSCWRSCRCRCGRGRQCRDDCDAYVFRAGATRGERNGPAAEQAPMAQRTRHGRPSDKGQTGCAPQSACYWHAIGGLSAYYLGRIPTVTAIFPARIFKVL